MAFADIFGQAKALDVLRQALRHERIPHAYVFAGPEGIGKKLTAVTLAKALNCQTRGDDACDQCPACHKIGLGNHPDVRVIEPDGQGIKIDQIREVQKDAGYKPFEGRRKVYILDQAETMRPEAANALLKTLEEPSADCVLILVTANVYALLPTVMSRCQFVRFVALEVDKLVELLIAHFQMPPARARLVASLSGGCPGKALAMDAEQVLAQRENMERLLKTLSAGLQDVRVLFDQVEALTADKTSIQDYLDLLLLWYRDVYVLHEHGEARLAANADALERLTQTARELSAQQLQRLFDIVYRAKFDLLRNANLQLTLEVMLMSLTEVYNDRNRWREISPDRESL